MYIQQINERLQEVDARRWEQTISCEQDLFDKYGDGKIVAEHLRSIYKPEILFIPSMLTRDRGKLPWSQKIFEWFFASQELTQTVPKEKLISFFHYSLGSLVKASGLAPSFFNPAKSPLQQMLLNDGFLPEHFFETLRCYGYSCTAQSSPENEKDQQERWEERAPALAYAHAFVLEQDAQQKIADILIHETSKKTLNTLLAHPLLRERAMEKLHSLFAESMDAWMKECPDYMTAKQKEEITLHVQEVLDHKHKNPTPSLNKRM